MFSYELNLRKLDQKDLNFLLKLKMSSQEYHHRTAIINETDQNLWFNSIHLDSHHPKSVYLVGSSEDEMDVGVFGLANINYINGTAEILCDIIPELRNQGYGGKLLRSGIKFSKSILNLRKLGCEVLENNNPCMKMLTKNGFSQEGIKVKQVFKNGDYLDSVIFGLML
jgi:putative acetyltransferase